MNDMSRLRSDTMTPGVPISAAPRVATNIVAAYFGPWAMEHWDALASLRPSIVVINPDSGPGSRPHGGYVEIVERCERLGASVYGYVSTRWLDRSFADIAVEVAHYGQWYGVSGVFFDEIPNGSARGRVDDLSRLDALTGHQRTVFNCGAPVPLRWYRLLPDVLWGTFEGGPDQLAASTFRGPPRRQIHLVHSVSPLASERVHRYLDDRRVRYVCVTEDEMPNPWDVCPTDSGQ